MAVTMMASLLLGFLTSWLLGFLAAFTLCGQIVTGVTYTPVCTSEHAQQLSDNRDRHDRQVLVEQLRRPLVSIVQLRSQFGRPVRPSTNTMRRVDLHDCSRTAFNLKFKLWRKHFHLPSFIDERCQPGGVPKDKRFSSIKQICLYTQCPERTSPEV